LNLTWFEVVGLGPVAVFAIFPVYVVVLSEEWVVVFVQLIGDLLEDHTLSYFIRGKSSNFILEVNLFLGIHPGWIRN